MAENKKIYQIQINGVEESISAVEALNKQLTELEARIKALENKSVKVSASSSGGGGSSKASNVSAMSEEEKLAKQIEQIDAKREAYSKEIYQNYLAAKDVLKETVDDQKQIAAQERLQSNSYGNTMQGMKQQLADIKQVMQTTDIDSDAFKKLTTDANELNSKLKELETSYGQFGRNVGNYANGVAEGLQKVSINVGGVQREFGSAREASRTLNNELKTMAANGQQDTDAFKQLRQVVMELESNINDAKKPMDNLMDAMEGVMAVANVGQGIRALFGIDDSEIQKSIQRLVALQNVLKGLETINKQIETREGVGKWIKPFTTNIDAATKKLLVYNRALLGTSTAAKVAATGIKLFSKALKTIVSGGILIALDMIVEKFLDIVDSFKKVDEAAERSKKVQEEVNKAYAEATAKITAYTAKVKNFNGNKKQEKKLVEELNREMGNSLGTYNSLAQWMDVLINKGSDYVKMLTLQAKAQASFNQYVKALETEQDAFGKSNAEVNLSWGEDILAQIYDFANPQLANKLRTKARVAQAQAAKENAKAAEEEYLKSQKEVEDFMESHKIGDYSPQIEKGGKKTKDAVEKTDKTITDLELRLMRDGLNKKLRQLDEEERQTINKLRENGIKSAAEIEKVHRQFDLLRKKEIDEYLKNIEQSVNAAAENIKKVGFEINTSKLQNQLSELQNEFEFSSKHRPIRNMYISRSEASDIKKDYKVDDSKIEFAKSYQNLFDISEATNRADEYYSFLNHYIVEKDKELFADIADYHKAIYETTDEEQKQVYLKGLEDTYKKVSDLIEKEYANELLYIRNYTQKIDQTLTESFEYRINAEKKYDENYRQTLMQNLAAQAELNKKIAKESVESAKEAESTRYSTQMSGLTLQKEAVKEAMSAIEKTYKVSGLESVEAIKDSNKEIYERYHDLFAKTVEIDALIETAKAQHKQKLVEITKEGEEKIKKIEIDSAKEISDEQEKTFNNQITNIRDAQSKINEILSQQPLTNSLGIVNVSATKKQYKEIEVAAQNMVSEIIAQQQLLNVAFSKGLIKPDAMNAIKTQLNDLLAAFKQTLTDIKNSSNDTIPKFMQSAQVYIQAVMDSYRTIMDAVWDAQNNQFEKEQEELDKMNEILDKKLDEQQEIVEQHKNAIDSIEDELATSRGDRRQHLIDQLNAEMEAERAAEREKQRIEKEREANEKKQDALEKKRRKAQYKRDLLQAIVNGAMAVTYASMNTWPVPAIPLMALAAATTAAQVAIMSANKPYAKGGQLDGGVAVGKRHRDGGIPVLGGRASIEGGEFITNRTTTSKNVDLLEYINSKKKKVDLNDLIEFYSGGTVKKSIKLVKSRFEDGGYIQPLPQSLDIRDQLQNVIINQDNRPIYVSVVDINNKQEDVRRVQTLAGLTE